MLFTSRHFSEFRARVFPHSSEKKRNYLVLAFHWFGIYWNNYSPQCRWRVVDIYHAASQLGKYPPLVTSTLEAPSFNHPLQVNTSSSQYRVCSWRPCWRSKTIKSICKNIELFSQWKRILLFSPPAWPLRTHSIIPLSLSTKAANCV